MKNFKEGSLSEKIEAVNNLYKNRSDITDTLKDIGTDVIHVVGRSPESQTLFSFLSAFKPKDIKFEGFIADDIQKVVEGKIEEFAHKTYDATDQFTDAKEFGQYVKDKYGEEYEINTTGHSLGGGEANYVAAVFGFGSLTFNPAAVKHLLTEEQIKRMEESGRNISYVDPRDPVGTFSHHPGTVVYLENQHYGLMDKSMDAHALTGFRFDKYGRIIGLDGRPLLRSPNGAIEIYAEDAIQRSEGLKKQAQYLISQISVSKRDISNGFSSPTVQGAKLGEALRNLSNQVSYLERIYFSKIQGLASYMDKKANDFKRADGL
ncbi:hypothetical protein [Ectobacillus panaciterrae]|uniref:hypothetical protein n=1 Tax=Ectobacillus panaciterrae TaxID=363872 RepID=UPI0004293CFF|nr:hypothetical protein [Ectobacillus panaciterrae]